MPRILVLNAGSSSVKYGLFDVDAHVRREERVSKGAVDLASHAPDESAAIGRVLDALAGEHGLDRIAAVGHRLVHGGAAHVAPVVVTAEVRAELERIVPLAPEHLPRELRLLDACARRVPNVPQVACFDTAFHRTMPARARLFGIPREYADEGLVRYGFHGLSYEYIVDALRHDGVLPRRLVIAHLGNGASMCAVLDGESIDTSMGFTPAGGIVMGTRSGDLDPGVLFYLWRRGLTVPQLDAMVNERGGLRGLSATTSDMRELIAREPTDPRAADAIAVFCYRIRKTLGAYATALGGLDAFVFTGGIGEHAAEVRARVCEGLEWLGIAIDPTANATNAALISARGTSVAVRVIPTDEERMIARHAARVIANGDTASTHGSSAP